MTTLNLESLKAQAQKQTMAQAGRTPVARTQRNHEQNAVIMHRGGKVACVGYVLNGSRSVEYQRLLFPVPEDTYSMPSIAVLAAARRYLEYVKEVRTQMEEGNPDKMMRVRLTLMDAAAVTAFSMVGKFGKQVKDIAGEIIAATGSMLENNGMQLTEGDVDAITGFVDAYVELQGLGIPVYFQKYVNAVNWDITIPEGVEAPKPGERIEFIGNMAADGSGIQINQDYLSRRATYTVGTPYYSGRNEDGSAKYQPCVVRPNTSVSGRRMAEAIQKVWAMLPEQENTETEVLELNF